MAIKINFDASNIPENPTLNLANRSGNKLGLINAKHIVVKDCMNDAVEISFAVNKYLDGKLDNLWSKIKDFKLVYCKEIDMWFEATVTIDESNEIIKNVSCVQLGQAELSQIFLHNIEINTEDDIARDDYKEPTILFNEENHSSSLLHRIMEKAQHYHIAHVDSTIAKIQRTFSFDNKSIYDAFQEIAEEIGCLFVFHSDTDDNGKIRRAISVYDLESNCLSCNHRGEFNGVCPKCNSKEILEGYGKNTTIFVTSDELGKNISFQSDTDSTKNYFKLEAGDDLMTATIRNCNPNGSDYIVHISDELKEDMSDELVAKLNSYDTQYKYYQNEYSVSLNNNLLNKYNQLVDKYNSSNKSLEKIVSPIIGYINLMTAYYKTIDMGLYLQSGLLPNVTLSSTNASKEALKLTSSNLSPVSISSTYNISLATANNAVLSIAKCFINSNYQVKVNTSSINGLIWTGNFTITNYSDDEDTANSNLISITISDDYQNFVNQKIQKVLSKDSGDTTDISGLFNMKLSSFEIELKKYNLDSLNNFWDMCQSCIDILIEQGIADKKSWDGQDNNLYDNLYLPYFNKLKSIESEQKIRQNEVNTVLGVYDINGNLTQNGFQTIISEVKLNIQKALNFENYLGNNLWLEFCAYRREDTYKNDNYISDGLDNAELFSKALEFIDVAENEIYKSSELQHSITATLQNLLVIEKFKKIVQYFEVGNWIRVQVDEKIYKLRLLEYEIDYDNLEDLSVTFSDVMKTADGYSDQESILKQAGNMATSYDSVQRQANQGEKTKKQLDNWATKGLALTKMKIIDNADNQNITWDSHGLLCREYLPITDNYSDKQLKIINKGLYLTDDGWLTSRAGIGNFTYYNPETSEIKEGYGVIADTIIGNLILSEKVGVYNKNNSVKLDQNGLTITADSRFKNENETMMTIQRKILDSYGNEKIEKIMYVDSNGQLVINGSVKISSSGQSSSTGQSSTIGGIQSSVDKSVSSVNVEYYLSTSPTSLSGGTWVTDAPDWEDGKYMWSRTKTILNDGTINYKPSEDGTCIAGATGNNGEDAVLLRIESSRGTVFKNDSVSTVLSVVIYSGEKRITNIEQLKETFGYGAYLQWKWQRINEDSYGIISASDERFGNDGFTFTLSPDDVDTKVTFMCELITV